MTSRRKHSIKVFPKGYPATLTHSSICDAGAGIAFHDHFVQLISWDDSAFVHSNGWTLWFRSLPRRVLGPPAPMRGQRKRWALSCQLLGSPRTNLTPDTLRILSSTVSTPEPLRKGRGLRIPTLLPSIKYTVSAPSKENLDLPGTDHLYIYCI